MEMTSHAQRILSGAFAGALALSLGMGLTGCAGNNDSKSDTQKSSDGVTQVNVTLKDNTQEIDTTEVEAGPVTFNVTNESAAGISEFELLYNQKIVGEKENLAPGLDTVSFTVTLDGGDYKLYAPGADEPYKDFKVSRCRS